ncbi:MAG TPA: polysaccharide biosynthesis tyrosine autokinase [Chthonomonadales bacterium]|nr:polysaccharide biosynthesis tyrosine autokinase [Chthonomonadales bacterium]
MEQETTGSLNEIPLREYLDVFRRRKAIIIQTFVVVVVVGIVATYLTKPVYRSTARILVEGKAITVAQYNPSDPLGQILLPPASYNVSTQLEVLQSNAVREEAYKKANVKPEDVSLSAKQVEETDVIEINAESTSASDAERLARVLPETYKEYVLDTRGDSVKKALEFAEKRLQEENSRLIEAELELQNFRRANQVANLDEQRGQQINQVMEAEKELRRAEAELTGNEVRLQNLIATYRSLPRTIDTPTTTTNPKIEEIKNDIAKLKTERSKALVLFKPNNPEILKIDAQIADLEERLKQASPTITTVTSTPNPVLVEYEKEIAQARGVVGAGRAEVAKLRARMQAASQRLGRYTPLEIRQAQLQRRVDQARQVVTNLATSVENLRLRYEGNIAPVRIISPAGPAQQVAPRKMANLVVAALLGLMLGVCFALLQEYLDDRVNSPEEGRRILEAPVLGYVPLIEREDQRLLNQARGSSVLESYRVLRSNVQFAAVDTPTSALLVTSTLPGEGKSMTAVNLAIAMAMDGRSVILVDADLRRPTIHEKFGLERRPGLTNVLVGHTTLADALKTTNVPGLRVLTSGPLPPNPAELLNSKAMRQLHTELKEAAEIVIFDSPPMLATADAQVLSAETDGVIYVVQFGEAKKSAMRHASELFHQARANLLGIVFNKIDLTSKRDGYYSGYYHYYSYYHSGQLEDGQARREDGGNEFEALIQEAKTESGRSKAIAHPESKETDGGA